MVSVSPAILSNSLIACPVGRRGPEKAPILAARAIDEQLACLYATDAVEAKR